MTRVHASELYQKAVLDHNRAPRHYGPIKDPTHHGLGSNPICGDHVEIFVLVGDDCISNISFTARSCALCKASASILCESMDKSPVIRAQSAIGQFYGMIKGETHNGTAGLSSDAISLGVTKDFPARAKCVILPWQTFEAALSGRRDAVVVTTEQGRE